LVLFPRGIIQLAKKKWHSQQLMGKLRQLLESLTSAECWLLAQVVIRDRYRGTRQMITLDGSVNTKGKTAATSNAPH
jgi:hypothetical protein